MFLVMSRFSCCISLLRIDFAYTLFSLLMLIIGVNFDLVVDVENWFTLWSRCWCWDICSCQWSQSHQTACTPKVMGESVSSAKSCSFYVASAVHFRLSSKENCKLRIECLCSHFIGRELFQIRNIWKYLIFLPGK